MKFILPNGDSKELTVDAIKIVLHLNGDEAKALIHSINFNLKAYAGSLYNQEIEEISLECLATALKNLEERRYWRAQRHIVGIDMKEYDYEQDSMKHEDLSNAVFHQLQIILYTLFKDYFDNAIYTPDLVLSQYLKQPVSYNLYDRSNEILGENKILDFPSNGKIKCKISDGLFSAERSLERINIISHHFHIYDASPTFMLYWFLFPVLNKKLSDMGFKFPPRPDRNSLEVSSVPSLDRVRDDLKKISGQHGTTEVQHHSLPTSNVTTHKLDLLLARLDKVMEDLSARTKRTADPHQDSSLEALSQFSTEKKDDTQRFIKISKPKTNTEKIQQLVYKGKYLEFINILMKNIHAASEIISIISDKDLEILRNNVKYPQKKFAGWGGALRPNNRFFSYSMDIDDKYSMRYKITPPDGIDKEFTELITNLRNASQKPDDLNKMETYKEILQSAIDCFDNEEKILVKLGLSGQ